MGYVLGTNSDFFKESSMVLKLCQLLAFWQRIPSDNMANSQSPIFNCQVIVERLYKSSRWLSTFHSKFYGVALYLESSQIDTNQVARPCHLGLLLVVGTSARAFSHQWTDLTSTQWHTAFTDLTSVGQISPHPNGTPQETKSDWVNYAIPMCTIPLRSAIPEFKKASCFRCISRSSSQWHTG